MKFFRVLTLCAIVAAAGYLAADDGGGAMGSGNRDGGWMGGPGATAGGDGTMGSGVGIAEDDGGGFFGGGTMGSGGIVGGGNGMGSGNGIAEDDGTGFLGGGTLSEYHDENGSRFFVVAFDDGSWFAFGIQ